MSALRRPLRTLLPTLIFCNLFFGAPCVFAQEPRPEDGISWVEEKGEHFILYTQHETLKVREIMREAEKYYHSVAERLNFPRHDDFWMWDARVKIYLYDDKETYLAQTQEAEWSLGMADYGARIIYSYMDSERFLTSVLPHEITHLIFRDFYRKENELAVPPYWLDEGVAQWSEDKETKDELKRLARDVLKLDGLLTISDILLLNVDYVKKNPDRLYFRMVRTLKDRYSVIILSPDVLINTFYVQSGSLVGYLIETFGARRFASFCREISRERAVSNALRAAYPKYFQSLRDLENGWRAYLLED